ncbi:GNAT family N-acetyltransferase [Granulicella sp. S190]|uniref:GNAT family N-acetyltransferase n=1 Tax=Granulicella sp. S190 TaxID=1747226 RepID=UPI001C2035ED|nr:GNAT family protein [Granulicella sp. S190]
MTERLVLRRWRESDKAPFRKLNADARVAAFLRGPLDAVASDAMVERIERHFERNGFGLFAVEVRESGEFAGFIGLSVADFAAAFTPAVEIGWRLAAEHWGKGLATEGAREVLCYGFDEIGLSDVVSFTVPANARSRAVMERLGMSRDPTEDFVHPNVSEGDDLRLHVLYRLEREAWARGVKG